MRSLRDPPTPLQNLKPDVDPAFAELLEKCLAKEPEKRPTAAFVASVLRGGGSPGSSDQANAPHAADLNVLESLLNQRLPQTVVVTLAVGLAALAFIAMLADVLDNPLFQVGLATFLCSLVASGIIAWFHGEKGPQKVTPLEVVLLGFLVVVWVALIAVVLIW